MKHVHLARLLGILCLAMGAVAHGQSSDAPGTSNTETKAGVPIEQIVATIARKTGKRFVMDPRVRANVVLVGTTPADLSYPEFLTVLEVYGFAAVENGKLVRVIPDANLRQFATPVITAKDTYPGSEFVTELVTVRNLSAAQLIPILRPMVSQYGHMAAAENNTLLIADHFDNVRRLEGLIKSLDAEKLHPPAANTAAPAAKN